MPQRCLTSPQLPGLIRYQHQLIRRDQALQHGLTAEAIKHRLAARLWWRVLPKVYAVGNPDELTRQQQLIAAQLYAGEAAAIDSLPALWFHGSRACPPDWERVPLVAPFGQPVRSRGFVTVRRTVVPFRTIDSGVLRFLEPAAAAVAAARTMKAHRRVLALFSDVLQRNLTTYSQLVVAHVQGPPRGARLAETVLDSLSTGIRSVGEAAFMRLAAARPALRHVEYNVWLRLPNDRILCVDALMRSSATVHETNGRVAHRRQDLFEDMQVRHDLLTVAGFTVLHNYPRRIDAEGEVVVDEFEQCHLRNDGRGLPPGVRVLTPQEVAAYLRSIGQAPIAVAGA